MTLPRVLSLSAEREGIRLLQQPVEELSRLRGQEHTWRTIDLSSEVMPTALLHGDLIEIEAEFELGSGSEFGIKLGGSQDECILIGYNCHRNELYMDRAHLGRVDFHTHFASEPIVAPLQPLDGRIKLHLFVDWSSIEVFANEGRVVMTNQIFPETSTMAVIPYVIAGTATLVSLTAYSLHSIYK